MTEAHTSYSQVNQYLRCGLAYQFKYRSGLEPEFLPEPLVFGSAFHLAAEEHFRAVMEDRPTPDLDELHKTFTNSWLVQVNASPVPIRFKEGEDVDTQSDLARRMLGAFLEYVESHEFNIVAVEQRFRVDLGGGLPVLVAYIDLVEKLPNGELCIIDIKTSARKYPETSAFDSLQFAAYASIAKAQGHEGVVQVKYLVVIKGKAPAVQELLAVLDDHDVNRFTSIAQAVHVGVDRGVFVPNPSWACGGCQWQRACTERLSQVV